MADQPVRVIIWGTPRSLSTAFIKAMTHVEDSTIWCAPYLFARRKGPDGPDRELWKDAGTKISRRGVNLEAAKERIRNLSFGYIGADASYAWIKEHLEKDAPGKKLIFVKDIALGITGLYDKLPNGFRHAFLLRHPIKVLMSFKKMISSHNENVDLRNFPRIPPENFYKELVELYEYVKREKIEEKPVIVCTEDLQRNPEGVMKAFCKELSIPYNDRIVNWDINGEEIMHKWMIARENAMFQTYTGLHKNVFSTSGFLPPSKIPDISDVDEDIAAVAEMSMKYYDALYKERLVVG